MRRSIVLASLCALAAAGAPAAASPGEAPWDGAVFAGPTAPHPANVAANPAAMILSTPGTHWFVGGVGALEQLGVERTLVAPDGATAPGATVRGVTLGAGGHVGVMQAWPGGMLAFVSQLPPPEETLAGRDALAFHTRGSRSRTLDLGTLAFAYRVTSRVSVGVAGTYSWRYTTLRFARDTALEAGRDPTRGVTSDCGGMACGLEHPAATELWTIDVDADRAALEDLGLSGGLLLVVPGGALVGLTYQRPWNLGRNTRVGRATIVAAPRDGGGVRTGDTTLFDRHPEVVRLGARARLWPRWDGVGEVRWRRLGRVGRDDVRTYGGDLASGDVPAIYPRPRGLHDAWALEAGLEEVDDGQVLRLGARLGADSGPVGADQLSARAPWGAQLGAGGGAQLRLGSRWVLQASYNVAWQLPVDVTASAFDPLDRLDCVDSGYDVELAACQTVRDGYGAPTAAGRYTRWSHVGRLSLRLEVP